MTAEEFLAKLEQADLTPPEIVASLRRQVAAAKDPIAPATIAKLLVDKHHLTPGQAQKLLGTAAAATKPTATGPGPSTIQKTEAAKTATGSAVRKSTADPQPKSQPAAAPSSSSVLDDLGLAPLDEIEPSASTAAAPQSSAKSSIAKSPAQKPPAQTDELGLAALDDLEPAQSPAAAPPPAAPKSAIQKTPAAKPLVDDLSAAGLDPLGDLQPLDGLEPLGGDALSSDPFGGDPLAVGGALDPLGGGADLGGALAMQTATPAKAQISPATMAAVNAANESRTTLFVGIAIGSVALLVVIVGLAVFFWPRGDGAAEFQAAELAYQEKQYAAAIEKYDLLLRLHPQHEQASLMRVHRGMCQIHAATSPSPDWDKLLPTVHSTAQAIAAEPALPQVHPELAPLLLQMTEALAAAATEPKLDDQSEMRLNQARTALGLCNDSRLLPGSLRPWQKLAEIDERLQLLAREVARNSALNAPRTSIANSLTAGDLNSALAERSKLLSNYPELAGDSVWDELASKFAAAAASSVKTSAPARAAEREAAKAPWLVNVPWQVLNGLQTSPPGASEQLNLVVAAGAVHALDADNGALRWSRFLGCSALEKPLVSIDGKTAWLVDRRESALLCLNAASGNLIWRQPLANPAVGSPILLDGKIYLSLQSGQIHSFEARSGELQQTAELPQPLTSGIAATDDGKQLLQLGNEGLLYALDPAELRCTQAVYTGHARGLATLPPVAFQRQIVIALPGAEQTELLLGAFEIGGSSLKRQQIEGTAAAPPTAAGKHLLLSTAQGEVHLLELTNESTDSFHVVQTIPAASGSPALRYLQASPDGVISAGRGLSLLKFDAAGKLQPAWSVFGADLFDAGCQPRNQSLVGVRYVASQNALYAAGVNPMDGQAQWQTPLHLPFALLQTEDETSQPIAVHSATIASLLATEKMPNDPTADFKQLLGRPANTNLKGAPCSAVIKIGDEQLIVPPRGSRDLLFVKTSGLDLRTLKLPHELAGIPAECGQNLLVPLRDGSIECVNRVTGERIAAPYTLPGIPSSALPVTVHTLGESGKDALVADGQKSIARIRLIGEPAPHWAELAVAELPAPLAASPATLAEVIFAVDQKNQLHAFAAEDLTAAEATDLRGGLTWGPHRANEYVLLATDRDELWCFDATRQARWRQTTQAGPFVGPPLVQQGKIILVGSSGRIEVRAAASGDLVAAVNLQQPVAGPALLSGNTVWLPTACGQVIQLAIPSEQTKP